MVDKRLGRVTTWCKDSKYLLTLSTVMKSSQEVVQQRNDKTVIDVQYPSDGVIYQNIMGDVDWGDHHQVTSVGFIKATQLKNWLKMLFFGITDIFLLQAFTAWNLPANQIT